MRKLKIAYLDIENSPSVGFVWGKYKQNVIEFVEDWFILGFSIKWEGGKHETYILPDFPGYKNDKKNDKKLVQKLAELLSEADLIVGHNGDRFDLRKINARMLFHRLQPLRPIPTVDTLKIARSVFKFDSNRLDDIGKYLGIGRKVATKGKDTWLGCINGDMQSWRLMKAYNKQDVVVLYELYKLLRPWIRNHPNLGLMMEKPESCPICGENGSLQKRGYRYTRTGKKPSYQCKSCGGWSIGKNISTAKVV